MNSGLGHMRPAGLIKNKLLRAGFQKMTEQHRAACCGAEALRQVQNGGRSNTFGGNEMFDSHISQTPRPAAPTMESFGLHISCSPLPDALDWFYSKLQLMSMCLEVICVAATGLSSLGVECSWLIVDHCSRQSRLLQYPAPLHSVREWLLFPHPNIRHQRAEPRVVCVAAS